MPKPRPSKTYKCYCTSLKCNGSNVSATSLENHRRLDEAAQRRQERTQRTTMDTVVDQVFRMTLDSRTSTAESKCGDAFWERTGDKATQRLFRAPDASDIRPDHSVPKDSGTPISQPTSTEAKSDCTSGPTDERIQMLYATLVQMDHEIDQHAQIVDDFVVHSITNISDEPLRREERWFFDTIDNIQVVNPGRDVASIVIIAAMTDKALAQLSVIKVEMERRDGAQIMPVHEGIVFNTGRLSFKYPTAQC